MREVVARIARALTPGGFLFLGHAETLRGLSHAFHLCHSNGCFYYRLREEGGGTGEASPAPALRRMAPPAFDDDTAWVDAIQRATERIAALETPIASAPPERTAASPSGTRVDRATVLELMRQDRIPEAIALMGRLPPSTGADPDAQLLRAVLLTSCGQLEQAETVCEGLLYVDDLNAGAEHAGDRQGASEHDQAAAYLDPGFAMPRLHLGLLAKRAGDMQSARQQLAQAEMLLEREDASRILLFGGGFRREGLLQLCRAELRACGGGR
jgi:chemotaxis protein methyltransferase CheR